MILFIESNTTGSGMKALKRTKEMGFYPVFLTNDPTRYQGLSHIDCLVVECDTNSVRRVQKKIDRFFQTDHIIGITTTSDFYLEIVAELQQVYQLQGNSPKTIRTCRHKGLSRMALDQHQVLQPKFWIVNSKIELQKISTLISYPVVVKPVDDSGSNGVKLCHDIVEVITHTQELLGVHINVRGQSTEQSVLIEEYVDAPEFSVEMFSDKGDIHFIGITQKEIIGNPYFVEAGHIFPAPLSGEQILNIKNTVIKALQAVQHRFGPSHTEVKWTPQGASVIEINARLAGGMIPELIRISTGVDLLDQQIRMVSGSSFHISESKRKVSGIRFLTTNTSGVFNGFDGVEKAREISGIEQIVITAQKGKKIRPPQNAYDRLGYIVAKGSSSIEVKKKMDEALSKIRTKI